MDIRFSCQNISCRQTVSIGDEWAGRFIKCPRCGGALEVPSVVRERETSEEMGRVGSEAQCVTEDEPGRPSGSVLGAALRRHGGRLGAKLRVLWAWSSARRRFLVAVGTAALTLWAGWGVAHGILRSWRTGLAVQEIASVGEFRDAAVGDHSGERVAFVRITGKGRILHLKERSSTEPKAILEINLDRMKSFSLLGWSPDDRYLVAAQRPDRLSPGPILYFFDGGNGDLLMANKDLSPVESLVWTSPDEFVFVDGRSNYTKVQVREPSDGGKMGLVVQKAWKGRPSAGAAALVAMGAGKVGIVQEGNLWSLDVETWRAEQLSSFTNMTFEWLDYSLENNAFLFRAPAAPPRKYPRVLYRFNPAGDKRGSLEALTETQTYNGRWISNGRGYAYVGSEGNENFLVVRVFGPAEERYLFESGFIRAFGVDAAKQRLLAFASRGVEPHGIWEYDINERILTNTVPGMKEPFEFARILRPHNKTMKIRGRRALPYTLIPPRDFKQGRKYPAVIDGPNSKRWRPEPQALANAGIYYVSANRRGLASSDSFFGAAEDIASLHELMSKHPGIDPDRIFLMGTSYGTRVMIPLIRDFPELWRGVILHSPVVNLELHHDLWRNPRYLITIGEEDAFHNDVRQFELDACHHWTLVDTRYYPGMGHGVASTEFVRDRVAASIDFILSH